MDIQKETKAQKERKAKREEEDEKRYREGRKVESTQANAERTRLD